MKMIRINLLIVAILCMAFTQAYAQKSYIVRGATKRIAKEIAEESGERIAKKSVRTFRSNYIENAVTEQSLKKIAREKIYQKLKSEGIKSFLAYGSKKAVAKTSHTSLSIVKNKYAQSFKRLGYKERLALSRKKGGTAVAEDVASKNAKLLKRYASRSGLTPEKQAKLLQEMNADEGLANLIRENPEFNIKRWLNTRNHVDKSLLAKTSKGRTVPNGSTYAGNIFYFNPHLNSKLKSKLSNNIQENTSKKTRIPTYDELIKLDKLYPEGVPFSKEGYPDFSKVAAKGKDGKVLRIDIKSLSGDSQKDINAAETIYQNMGYQWEPNYTWHHIENSTELIRVPTVIHQLIPHAGGMSTYTTQILKQAS